MSRRTFTAAALIVLLTALGLAFITRDPATEQTAGSGGGSPLRVGISSPPAGATAPRTHVHSSFLYGRITAADAVYEGRLRWGGDQEAFWGDYFNGAKRENPWAAHAPGQSSQRRGIEIFGIAIGGNRSGDLERLFMTRFGDIARIEAHFSTVHVTLKSGTVVSLDRFAAGDIDDGVRVWDARHGVVDLDARRIRTIEFLPTPPLADGPERLHGLVRTRQGEFTGFLQWDQVDGVSTDTLDGRAGDDETSLPYGRIRSIARHSPDSARVTLRDGRDVVLSDGREVGRGHRGIYVDDTRYGRVLISWDAFERVDFSPGGSAAGYADFPPGRPLAGSVTTTDGRRLAGRLVYDFDESETTETVDVSAAGVDYVLPFGLVASIVPPRREAGGASSGSVVLLRGEKLALERAGDLGDRNAGLLIFGAGRERPEYVAWSDVERIDLEHAAPAAAASARPGVRR
jgi:hypothetical protein